MVKIGKYVNLLLSLEVNVRVCMGMYVLLYTYPCLSVDQNFRYDILSQCWDNVYESSYPNVMWQQWKCTFLAIADKHAPLKTMRVRSRSSPWITSELKDSMHNRDILNQI